jgi:hypothetical protein
MGMKRRVGKQIILFQTVREMPATVSVDDLPEQRNREIDAMNEIIRCGSLKAQLASYEKTARHKLEEHGFKHTGSDFQEYVGNPDLPLPASYAADILFHIQGVRNLVKNGDAKSAAIEAMRLGFNVAAMQAGLAVTGREGKRISTVIKARKDVKELRQERMKQIAIKEGWKPRRRLGKTKLQEIYTLLRQRYPEYKNKPTNQTLSNDAKEIGLRK